MVAPIIFTLFLGVILGLSLAFLSLWVIQVNCPKCKQLKPLKEVILFHWKLRTITGKLCQKCQQPKSQVFIEL